MKELIKRNLNGKKVLLLFIATNLVYVFMLSVTIPAVMQYSGGLKILDMMPLGYDMHYVNDLFDALGTTGREVYLLKQVPVDLLYPFLFGVSSCLVFAYFLNKLGKLDTAIFYLCFVPLFSGLFDYAENIGIILLLNQYPEHTAGLVTMTSIFSVLNSSFTTLYFSMLIVVLIAYAKNRFFRKTA
jgi:hypothetical protein